METRSNHADNRVVISVHGHALANDVWRRAELALPQARANDGNWGGASTIVVGTEETAQGRFHAQNRKKIRGNHAHSQALRLSAAGHTEVVASIRRYGRECGIASLPILEVRIRN